MAKTLYEYYKEKGQALPSVADRTPLAAQYGITNYSGTAEQNTLLLSKLTAQSAAPGNLPPAAPVAPPGAPGTSGGPAFSSEKMTETVGDLGNLRIALREALNEAGRKRVENNFKMVAPLSGNQPGTIGAVVDMIRGSVKEPVENTFKDITDIFQERQNFALNLSARYVDAGILPSDSPEVAARKASRSSSFLKSQKNEPTVAEKEQYEARSSEKELERKRGEGGFVDFSEYRTMKARSLLTPTEFDKRFSYFLSDGDQVRLREESASPTTRTAGDFSKGETIIQANLGNISAVGASDMGQFVAEITSVIQQETNLTEAEINTLIARYGFKKFGSVWVYQGGK